MLASDHPTPDDGQVAYQGFVISIAKDLECIDSLASLDVLFKSLDFFLEDPTVLDPFMNSWFEGLSAKLLAAFSSNDSSKLETILLVYNHFSKIRGVSNIRHRFPHDTEVARELLEQAPSLIASSGDWAVRSMIFVWCSIATLVPFKFHNESQRSSLAVLAQEKLAFSGKECSCAALYLSAMMRRPDSSNLTDALVEWTLAMALECTNGILELYIAFLKGATDISAFKPKLLQLKDALSSKTSSSSLTRKLYLRFLTRLCMAFSTDEELLQQVFDLLSDSLDDRDTKVRWAVAKGFGRLACFVEGEGVTAIFASLIAQGQSSCSPDALHGICMAIGQLISCNVLPEELQDDLAQMLGRCLWFELSKGTYAVGSNVRDAACYLAWSWAKYQPSLGANEGNVTFISTRLLPVSLFDREISCRRAAAAAFQELVGRTDCCPRGMEILSCISFFTVSSLKNCFDGLLAFASGLAEYQDTIKHYLLSVACCSFDKALRLLAARALGGMSLDRLQLETVLAYALNTSDPILAHSGLTVISHLLESGKPFDCDQFHVALKTFASNLTARTLAFQLLCESWLAFIRAYVNSHGISEIHLPLYLALVKSALRSRFSDLHENHCIGVLEAINASLPKCHPEITSFYRTVVLPGADKDFDPNAQRGFSAALSSIPTWLAQERIAPLTNLVCRLIACKEPINDVEKRACLARSAGLVYGRSDLDLQAEQLHQVFSCLIEQIDDYSVDFRGDVGSFLREEAMKALCRIKSRLSAEQQRVLLAKILHQAIDRLDRVRSLAIDLLRSESWPFDFSQIVTLPDIYWLILRCDLLEDEDFRLPLLLGWINSAGCPTPSVSNSAWEGLKVVLPNIVPKLVELDQLWDPKHRLCKPLLALFQRWSQDNNTAAANLFDAIAQRITALIEPAGVSIHTIIEGIRLLKLLPCERASRFLEESKVKSPYPRVRQLCSEEDE